MKRTNTPLNVTTCSRLVLIMTLFLISGCVSVKEYQMMYLNDPDMEMEDETITTYETDTEQYREGAAGANGRKAGGGCGCN